MNTREVLVKTLHMWLQRLLLEKDPVKRIEIAEIVDRYAKQLEKGVPA